jgi:hypothetical protein
MGLWEMVVLVVLITSGAEVLKQRSKSPSKKVMEPLLEEMRQLREEVRQLRQQNNDVVLNLDSTVQRLDRRLSHLEHEVRPLGAGEAENQAVSRLR